MELKKMGVVKFIAGRLLKGKGVCYKEWPFLSSPAGSLDWVLRRLTVWGLLWPKQP